MKEKTIFPYSTGLRRDQIKNIKIIAKKKNISETAAARESFDLYIKREAKKLGIENEILR